jgi:hypothetical protein
VCPDGWTFAAASPVVGLLPGIRVQTSTGGTATVGEPAYLPPRFDHLEVTTVALARRI